MSEERSSRQRTAAAMRHTADELEQAEGVMHHSAQTMPDQATGRRLHDLANQVTETATDIARRADNLPPGSPGEDNVSG